MTLLLQDWLTQYSEIRMLPCSWIPPDVCSSPKWRRHPSKCTRSFPVVKVPLSLLRWPIQCKHSHPWWQPTTSTWRHHSAEQWSESKFEWKLYFHLTLWPSISYRQQPILLSCRNPSNMEPIKQKIFFLMNIFHTVMRMARKHSHVFEINRRRTAPITKE